MRERSPGSFLFSFKVIAIVLIGHFIWMTLLYLIAGAYSGENPLEVVRHYGPAYLTAIGTMSSGRHTRSSPPVCRKGKAAAQRYGTVWNSSVFQHPSVWFCSHRSLLLHDGLQDSLRCSTCTRKPWCCSVFSLASLPSELRAYPEELSWLLWG